MQGRLRNGSLEVEIGTTCAHCDGRMKFIVDNDLDYRILEGGLAPLVFEPEIDWSRFKDPNIIDGY